MLVLGIETTCDETAAAVVARRGDGSGSILSNIVHSQTAEHARFGGVVPEIAARAHIDLLDGIIARAMQEAGTEFAQLSAVAAAAVCSPTANSGSFSSRLPASFAAMARSALAEVTMTAP